MTRRSLSGVAAISALALALLLPAAVRGDEDSFALTGFALKASNGYGLAVLAGAGPDEEEGWIGLFLARNKRTIVTYGAPATVSDRTIEADLGNLGRISVTRVSTGRTKKVRTGCHPRQMTEVESERYEGVIEFHGEEGFAEVSAAAAPAFRPYTCLSTSGNEKSAPDKSLPGARLDVEKRRLEQYRLEFDAIQIRPGARTVVRAEVEEHRGEIEIHRATATLASPWSLRYDQHLRGATVRPPAPFAGHGTFHGDARGADRWTGNLTVDFPGRSDVPIVGPGFQANLERPRG